MCMMIAEESTAWPGVTRPTDNGGLGFGIKWDMGWMHDTLEFLASDPIHRRWHHGELTFRTVYAFTENFVLPLSHDEVVHGKGSLLTKMPGDRWQQLANLRLLSATSTGSPGKKLLFMGAELGDERRMAPRARSLPWGLLDHAEHRGVLSWVAELNRLYRSEPALHRVDNAPEGFSWIVGDDKENVVLAFLRTDAAEAASRPVLVLCNFTAVPRRDYRVGVPVTGPWVELLNSDELALRWQRRRQRPTDRHRRTGARIRGLVGGDRPAAGRGLPGTRPTVTAAANSANELRRLAEALGVATEFVDGLGRTVRPGDDTLIAVCNALGARVTSAADAATALAAHRTEQDQAVPPVLVAWDGRLELPAALQTADGEIHIESGDVRALEGGVDRSSGPLPTGYHTLVLERPRLASIAVISAPVRSFPLDPVVRWGVGAHLGAVRTERSRSIADLRDLRALARWSADRGSGVVSLLPLLPTFNGASPEPSPYSPVSRLFWSELHLELGDAHRPTAGDGLLDLGAADQEVRAALGPDRRPAPDRIDPELARYARFRGAQARLGRAWMTWPDAARRGALADEHVDPDEERFHLVAQQEMRSQLAALTSSLDGGPLLGLDLSVGVHPHAYDVWSRQELFASGMSVGAPPDAGFPSGQNWGFPPVLPGASQAEGHRYLAESIAHQAGLAGVLRIDHVMALRRLYWIPSGAGLADGTYVQYPLEELFAVVCVESHRHRCAIVGENLGTVPSEIDASLARHGILGMYLAQFEAGETPRPSGPAATEAALINTHDTPSLAGWVREIDIDERLRVGLLDQAGAASERTSRRQAVARLERTVGVSSDPAGPFLDAVLGWLGGSTSPLVSVAIEDLWLESQPVNIPGTASDQRPNWRRLWARTLDDVAADPTVLHRLGRLAVARRLPGEGG